MGDEGDEGDKGDKGDEGDEGDEGVVKNYSIDLLHKYLNCHGKRCETSGEILLSTALRTLREAAEASTE